MMRSFFFFFFFSFWPAAEREGKEKKKWIKRVQAGGGGRGYKTWRPDKLLGDRQCNLMYMMARHERVRYIEQGPPVEVIYTHIL